ncbi:hypothetical protein TanjilG_09980 [Lupinus angustifolius]|uniref:Magnesium transporter n=1 Tax=Lupinus angustifolius TaxID=3871 RepID=A0A1J7FWI5_LUPAN|nr:hypothetical protein TanjilG_09980 [Lupinus angustifolius]
MRFSEEEKVIKPGADVGVRIRKKGVTGIRAWLLLNSTGDTHVIQAGKHAIMHRTGLSARDLRILDPLLSYPSTILGREKVIMINLEHIKAIITANEVLLLNFKDPSVTPFVDELHSRIVRHHSHASKTPNHDSKDDQEDGMKILPFEFVALEACLEAACGVLDNEAKTLEQEAHGALEKLTSKINTLNLELVRQIKSRLVAITGRVQKVRDELEHLLDDDQDMAEMSLTHKLFQHHLQETSSTSINDVEDDRHVKSFYHTYYLTVPPEISFGTGSTTYSNVIKQNDVGELEMLLEAYFVQIDGTLNKLSMVMTVSPVHQVVCDNALLVLPDTHDRVALMRHDHVALMRHDHLREYVDDTEDYINIMLDDKQNHLLQMGIMLSTATLVISAFTLVAGVFGINIHIKLFDVAGTREFLWTVGGSTVGTIFFYVFTIVWCKHKGLIL